MTTNQKQTFFFFRPDDDMLNYIVQSVGIHCDQAVAHTHPVNLQL